jgi:1-acyl-sn-glycerol-3-phosphate acyltransferase
MLLRLIFPVLFRYRSRHCERLPETNGGLILSNHQSYLDPLLIGLPIPRPISFIARENLVRIPILGTILRSCYVIPINRDSAGTESVREAVRRMNAGFLVGVFPEGTRSADGNLGEIKPGFVALARRAKQPIYPIGIAGADRAMPKGGLKVYPKKIRVIYGEPIPAEEVLRLAKKGNEEEFLKVIHAKLQECLDEANAWYES